MVVEIRKSQSLKLAEPTVHVALVQKSADPKPGKSCCFSPTLETEK